MYRFAATLSRPTLPFMGSGLRGSLGGGRTWAACSFFSGGWLEEKKCRTRRRTLGEPISVFAFGVMFMSDERFWAA
jgi:hypothetical protein